MAGVARGDGGEEGGDGGTVAVAMIDHAGAGGRRGRVGRGDGDGGVGAEIVAGDVVPIAFDAAVSAEDPCLAMARFGEGGDGMGGGDAVGVVEGDDLVVDDIVVAFVDAAAVGPVGERLGEGLLGGSGGDGTERPVTSGGVAEK